MSVRFCSACGARMTSTDRFCFNCGTPAVQDIPAPQIPAEPVTADPTIVVPEPAQASTAVVPVVPQEPVADSAPVMQQSIEELPPVMHTTVTPEPLVIPVLDPIPQPVQPQYPTYQPPVQPQYPSYQQPVYAAPPVYGTAPVYTQAPPAQPVPQPAAQPEQQLPAAKKPLKRRGFLSVFASILICIVLLALILPTMVLVDIRLFANEDAVLGMLERVELDEIPAADLVGKEADAESLLEWSCDVMNEEFATAFNTDSYHWSTLLPESVEAVLKESTFLDLTSSAVGGILSDLVEGESSYALTQKDLNNFLKKNHAFLEKEFKLYLSANDRENMSKQILDVAGVEELSLETLPEEAQPVLEIISNLLSVIALAIIGVVVTLLIVLLFAVNQKYTMAGIHDVGLVMLLSGLIHLVLIGGCRLLVSFCAGENGLLYLIGIVAGSLLESGLLVCASIFGFGLLLLLIAGITRSILKKKAAKA